jgi:hypothetical protein
MKRGSLAAIAVALGCAAGLLSAASARRQEDEQPDWQQLLRSVDPVVASSLSPPERMDADAMLAAVRDVQEAEAIARSERDATIAGLMEVLDSPVPEGEDYWATTPRNAAMRLLGELRAKEAVPALMMWLSPRPGQWAYAPTMMQRPAAAEALIRIGMPAVPALVETLALTGVTGEYDGHWVPAREGDTTNKVWEGTWPEKESPLGDECLGVLVTIEGLEEAEATLTRAISGEEPDRDAEPYGISPIDIVPEAPCDMRMEATHHKEEDQVQRIQIRFPIK